MTIIKLAPYIIFLVDKEKDDQGNYKPDGKLRMRVRWGSNIVAFSVGYRVKLSQWDTDTQRCKAKTTNLRKQSAADINAEIQRLETLTINVFKAFELQGHVPASDEVRRAFNDALGRANAASTGEQVQAPTFFDRLRQFYKEQGTKNNWSDATYKKFYSLQNHLTEFAPDMVFDDLDEVGLMRLVEYLRDARKMRNSSISKQLALIKWFLRWATSKGYNNQNAYLIFAPKLKTAERRVVFLDWDELMNVFRYDIPDSKKYLDRVRDVFCFCCFTSLRYSDVANLKRSDIRSRCISITTVKTADSLNIELNDYSRAILEKYAEYVFDNDLALPIISNQKMNGYLKELGELCGIDTPITTTYYKGNERIDEVQPKYELLGTHCGRRTFICNALMFGIAPQIVMKWTGHSDYKAMKPYIDVADSAKAEAMKMFNR